MAIGIVDIIEQIKCQPYLNKFDINRIQSYLNKADSSSRAQKESETSSLSYVRRGDIPKTDESNKSQRSIFEINVSCNPEAQILIK